MKKFVLCLMLMTIAAGAQAKAPSKIWDEFQRVYPPAEQHRQLYNAHDSLDLSKLRGYVVLLKGGVPAERAVFYISWGDYDYRGVVIDNDKVTTRRGKIYTFLQSGDVLAVSDVDHLGRTLYMKLITPDVYVPENRANDKRHSRVTVEINFKLPKDVEKEDNAEKAMELLGEWFKPFTSLDEAKTFAATVTQKN